MSIYCYIVVDMIVEQYALDSVQQYRAREYAAMVKALFGGRQPYSTTDIHLFLEQY